MTEVLRDRTRTGPVASVAGSWPSAPQQVPGWAAPYGLAAPYLELFGRVIVQVTGEPQVLQSAAHVWAASADRASTIQDRWEDAYHAVRDWTGTSSSAVEGYLARRRAETEQIAAKFHDVERVLLRASELLLETRWQAIRQTIGFVGAANDHRIAAVSLPPTVPEWEAQARLARNLAAEFAARARALAALLTEFKDRMARITSELQAAESDAVLLPDGNFVALEAHRDQNLFKDGFGLSDLAYDMVAGTASYRLPQSMTDVHPYAGATLTARDCTFLTLAGSALMARRGQLKLAANLLRLSGACAGVSAAAGSGKDYALQGVVGWGDPGSYLPDGGALRIGKRPYASSTVWAGYSWGGSVNSLSRYASDPAFRLGCTTFRPAANTPGPFNLGVGAYGSYTLNGKASAGAYAEFSADLWPLKRTAGDVAAAAARSIWQQVKENKLTNPYCGIYYNLNYR